MLPGPHKAVHSLEDFNLDHMWDEILRRRHRWHEVLHQKKGWATVLACYQDYTHGKWSGDNYRVVRLRHLAGAWRVLNHFNLKIDHLAGLRSAVDRAIGSYDAG